MKKQTAVPQIPQLHDTDRDALEGESSERVWIPVRYAQQLLWEENPKAHDIGVAIQSFKKYGFRDSPAFDRNLTNVNGESGAIVYGNGRVEALAWMMHQGDTPPRGILVHKETGEWFMPIEVGLDAKDALEAAAFGIDHNATTLSGGNLGLGAHAAIFDTPKLMALLEDVQHQGHVSVVFDEDDLQSMLASANGVFDQPPPAPSAPPPFDATKMEGTGEGGDLKTTYIIYVTLSDEDRFYRTLRALSYQTRNERREGTFYATLDGEQFLDQWEQDLPDGT